MKLRLPHLSIQRWLTGAIALSSLGCLSSPAVAQVNLPLDEFLFLQFELPDPRLLQPEAIPATSPISTSYHISQEGLTIPSLWWTQQQFGGKLLILWLAFDGSDGTPRRVEFVVNEQVWNIYTYIERFAFLNEFGTAARDFGYSSRIFNQQGDLLATYICDFSSRVSPPSCTVSLRNTNNAVVQ